MNSSLRRGLDATTGLLGNTKNNEVPVLANLPGGIEKRTSILVEKAMIFWITNFLALGFLLVEIYLLALRRSGDPKQQSDRGTLRVVWILIASGCLMSILESFSLWTSLFRRGNA